jgi:hypothetical protein
MALGPIQGWNTVRAPFFMKAAPQASQSHRGCLTRSKESVTGIIELRTDGGPVELTIDQDAALALCAGLERFFTQ